MRANLTAALRTIESEIASQLEEAITALGGLPEAIRRPDRRAAAELAAAGRGLRQLSRATDVRLVTLSATQAPVACDLRMVLTMMQICQHQCLIANQFVLIAEQLDAIEPDIVDRCGTTEKVTELAWHACVQLKEALCVFTDRDCARGEELRRSDELLNRLNKDVCRVSLELRASPEQRALAFRHVLIARSLERVGDNAVGIARKVAELVQGDVHQLVVASA